MKKSIAFCLLLVCSLSLCFAQGAADAVRQDLQKSGGTYYVYSGKDLPDMTPAPEGYQPFYISHFARHGARYCLGEFDYVYKWFSKASEEGVLTDTGKEFFKKYEPFYKKVKFSGGNLTGVGKAQHRAIADRMYQRFPAVFDGPTHVEAVSTESARVIMSMWSCLSGLMQNDKDLDVNADASGKYAPWLQPSLSSNPYLLKNAFEGGKAGDDALKEYFESTVPWKEIACRFFTSEDVLDNVLKVPPMRFLNYFYGVVSDARCLDKDQNIFDGVFTPEEQFLIWKGLSARFFLFAGNFQGSESLAVDYAAFTLGQIIETADADIASGKTQLRLRFGHDSGIAPLFVLLDAGGAGRSTSSFEESLDILPSYNIPMAASLQLVFYKNEGGDILLKALMNEREVTLPLQPVDGIYYRWSDFKEHFLPLVRDYKRKVIYKEPLATLKATDWGWRPVGDTKVEVGEASVNVFGSVQSISMARFPMKAHAVSVVESDGPAAAITSKFGTDNKAIAAINGSYFDTKILMPVTYVKDEGKVLCSHTSDGAYRNNGMFRIKDRKGRSVDIVTIDSLSTPKAAKGWREAIVSGPVLLEDGKPVIYEDDGSRSYRRFYSRRHPRTLLGYTTDGWIYFIVVDGRFPSQGEGMSINELEVLCESLGLFEAINLDGGGSSTLWAKDAGVINHPYDNQKFDHEGERVVPNVIIVK